MVTLVLADESGATTTLAGPPLPLDGRPHTTSVLTPGQPPLPDRAYRVVAIDLHLTDHTEADLLAWGTSAASVQLSITIGGATSQAGAWQAVAQNQDRTAVQPGPVEVSGDTVRAGFSYSVLGLAWQDAHLTLLSFPADTVLPVAMTDDLVAELGLAAGDQIALRWGTTSLQAEVSATVDHVPGRVGEPALLADLAALQRGLLSAGGLPPAPGPPGAPAFPLDAPPGAGSEPASSSWMVPPRFTKYQ